MERLTIDTRMLFCDISQCSETPGGSFCEDGYCDQRRCYERLREYERICDLDELKAIAHIGTQPTIDAVQVLQAHWKILEETNMFDACGNNAKYAACTNCGFRWNDIYAVKNYFKFCPSCGAKMDEETKN